MRLSELREKEVINIDTGENLGKVRDCEIAFDPVSGEIHDLILPTGSGGFRFFSNRSEERIPWDKIRKVSDEFILIMSDYDNFVS